MLFNSVSVLSRSSKGIPGASGCLIHENQTHDLDAPMPAVPRLARGLHVMFDTCEAPPRASGSTTQSEALFSNVVQSP
jgi:hypothetical protein